MTLAKSLKAILAASLLFSINTQAALITTGFDFDDVKVIDFEDQSAQQNVNFPVQIGNSVGEDITVYSSSNSNGLYFNYDGWGLLDNGSWRDKTYVSLNGSSDEIIFAFNGFTVASVGGFINYAAGSGTRDLIITAWNIHGEWLEVHNLTQFADIDTPGETNGGAFRGISRTRNDIAFFTISGGQANALDDFTFSRTPNVPEPESLLILLLGLGGIALRRPLKR